MRIALSLLALGVLSATHTGCSRQMTGDPDGALSRINQENVRRDIFTIASDSMMGRNTPSPQLDSAGAYIARAFDRAGLLPVNGSRYQRFPLNIVDLGDTNGLTVRAGGEEKSYLIKSEFVPFEFTADGAARGQVVFAGYGITAPEYKYDDYAGIDVRGKIVFVLRHEPGENDSASAFMGTAPTEYSSVETKMRIAVEHGAVGVLVATDPLNHASLTHRTLLED